MNKIQFINNRVLESNTNINNVSIYPSKVVCVGRNYVEHIQELGNAIPDEMVVFNKPNSSITNTLTSFHQEILHYEGEICFVIQNGELAGVGFGLDLTKRALQSKLKEKGLPWERAKAFDGSAVLSEFVAIEKEQIDDLRLELWINDTRIQAGDVKQMLYPPQMILAQLKTYTSLQDGDVIMTGTPKGVGIVEQGATFVGKIYCQDQCLLECSWLAH